jgi:uncharacterized membrane protein YkvI
MTPTFVQRFLLPGFAFKAVVIGGGYATGRELAEFFLPSGPLGGLLGMLLAMVCWSVICTVTFLFALATRSYDYGAFFRSLLGPAWFTFDVANICLALIILSVFGAAAGAIVAALFGWPEITGTLALVAGIALFAAFGSDSVERLFKYVTYFLYGVYAIFVVISLVHSSGRIAANFLTPHATTGWAVGGLTYTGYNIVGAVLILPVLRHLTGRRDAVIAGLLCGPLGLLPAVLFFTCMIAYYPEIGSATLPSDFMLTRLDSPVFHVVFQLMILAALLECGTGTVHAINQRIAGILEARNRGLSTTARFLLSTGMLVVSIFVAARFGLVTLIASGYRTLSYVFIAVYVVPLLSYGLWLLIRNHRTAVDAKILAPLDRAGFSGD